MRKGLAIITSIVCALLCIGYMSIGLDQHFQSNDEVARVQDNEDIQLETVQVDDDEIELDSISIEVTGVDEEFESSKSLDQIGKTSYSEAINVDDMTFNLYPTFENKSVAVENIKIQAAKLVDNMQRKYGLADFSTNSVQSYIDHYYEYKDYAFEHFDETAYNKLGTEMSLFESFVDIFENDECNEEIEQTIESLSLDRVEEKIDNVLGTEAENTDAAIKPMSYGAGLDSKEYELRDEETEEYSHEELNSTEDCDGEEINEKNQVNDTTNEEDMTAEELVDVITMVDDLYLMMPSNTGAAEVVEAVEEELIEEEGEIEAIESEEPFARITDISKVSYSKNSKFTVSKGISYAKKYAANPNKSGYGYNTSSGDCTNFVSQVKHEGGVPYYKTGTNNGWSHWTETHTNNTVHKRSIKWDRADAFVKFYGVKSKWKTTSYSKRRTAFIKFAAAVKEGSFIAYDDENDGSWNHCAFVTKLVHKGEEKRHEVDYHGSQYKDFKIAQHSRNYNAWVSGYAKKTYGDSGWEDLPFDHSKVVFAIIN